MKRVVLSAAIILMLVFCAGCKGQAEMIPDTYEYTDAYLRISEPNGSDFILNGNIAECTVEGRTYQFRRDITEEERNSFVKASEEVCRHLEKNGISASDLVFRVIPDYPSRADSENRTVYIDHKTVRTWEQAAAVIQTSLGDYTNAGYVYALADHISEKLSWEKDSEYSVNADTFREDPFLLNLVYTCFDEDYTHDTENINSCKALAIELLSDMDAPYAGEEEFIKEAESYAEKNGIAFKPTYVGTAYNGESCPLKIRTKYFELFRDVSYESDDCFEDGLIDEDYLSSTKTIVEFFEETDSHIEVISEKFPIERLNRIPVYMYDDLPRDISNEYFQQGGLYVSYYKGEPVIFISTLGVLAHEYTHHLYNLSVGGAYDNEYEGWHNEALAYYYTLFESFNFRILYAEGGVGWSIDELSRFIGEEYDEPSDEILFIHKVLRENDDYPLTYYLKTEHDATIDFADYFIKKYGETEFIMSMLYPSEVESYTGASMEQIIDDWCEYVKG